MKKVFVLGDSISIHYGPFLKQMLAGKMAYTRKGENGVVGDINQATDVNGGDSSHVLSYLQKMQRMDFDVLLLNCGLHDIKVVEGRQVEPEEYRENLKQVLELMRERGKPVVWVTTTPVDDEQHKRCIQQFARYNRDVLLYNEIASEVMGTYGVPVIDLYHFTQQLGMGEGIYADHVHYLESVQKMQAAYLAGALLALGDVANVF